MDCARYLTLIQNPNFIFEICSYRQLRTVTRRVGVLQVAVCSREEIRLLWFRDCRSVVADERIVYVLL